MLLRGQNYICRTCLVMVAPMSVGLGACAVRMLSALPSLAARMRAAGPWIKAGYGEDTPAEMKLVASC